MCVQIRKSRRPARLWQCGFIRNGKIATPARSGWIFEFIVFISASVTADFELTYSTRFGILFKPWACFLFATPATCIPPYCRAVVMPLPQANRDRLSLIKTTNSQDMICFRHMYRCGNLQMYRNTPTTYLFHCDVFLLRTDKNKDTIK